MNNISSNSSSNDSSGVAIAERKTIFQVEEGSSLAPKFNEQGLIPVVTTDYKSGELLMHGFMNEEAFLMTLKLKEAVYYSRSRRTTWHKGKTSGLVQKVKELRIDDDQDAIWLRVEVVGGASCHVGYRSCFYRKINWDKISEENNLTFTEDEKVFNPEVVYPNTPNPTQL